MTRPQVCLIRYQSLDICTLDTIESQGGQHRLIMEPVQIHGFSGPCSVLILVPRGDAERVALFPVEALAVDLAVAATLDDVVDRRRGLADCRGGGATGDPFGAAA